MWRARSEERQHPSPLDRSGRRWVALLTAVAAVLLLVRLGSPLLWEDEAETAVVSRNLLSYGYPSAWGDGHLVDQMGGAELLRLGDRVLWVWHPWSQYYLCAASFALLGVGTFSARLPFALVGLLSVPLFFLWRHRRADRGEAVVATAIYVGAFLTFLLFSRQCRYYPLLFLGGVLAFWGYEHLLADGGTRHRRTSLALGASLALAFYANPLSGGALAAGLLAHAAFLGWRRDHGLSALRRLLPSLVIFAALAAPWLAVFLLSDVRTPNLGASRRELLALSQLWRFQYALLPLVTWPALGWLWWRRRGDAGDRGRFELELLAVASGVSLVLAAAVAPLPTARYQLALWPLAAATLAQLWQALHRWRRAAAALFLVLLLGTNLPAALPVLPLTLTVPHAPFYDRDASPLSKLAASGRPTLPPLLFLRDLLHPSRGPVSALVAAVRELPCPPRAILTSYARESLHFYLGVPVLGGAGTRVARRKAGVAAPDLRTVDVVVPRRGWGPLPEVPSQDESFSARRLTAPDEPYENLPEPLDHRFERGTAPPLTIYVRRSLLADCGDGGAREGSGSGHRPEATSSRSPRSPGSRRERHPADRADG